MEMQRPMGSRVILVRHAKPVVRPDQPAGTWVLEQSATGSVTRLAHALSMPGADGVVASPEPKAQKTGRIIAGELGIPLSVDPDIREQGGGQVPWIGSQAEFRAAVGEHFAHPSDVVLGAESSGSAVDRFEQAVERARLNRQCPVLVTHGRIMCGYMSRVFGDDPMSIWSTLLMPDGFVLDFDAGQWQRIHQEERR